MPKEKEDESSIPEAVKNYAESQGLPLTHPRVAKYASKIVGRRMDDQIIEEPWKARPAWEPPLRQ